jgi:hypothetical protein
VLDIVNGNGHAVNGSPPSSPLTVHFSEPSHFERPARKPRSVSNTTISDDNKTTDHSQLQECNDENCAFGWETYVLDHACKASTTSWNRVSIHRLLHQEEDNPLLRKFEEGKIRHVHLPANNMKWVEVCTGLTGNRTQGKIV